MTSWSFKSRYKFHWHQATITKRIRGSDLNGDGFLQHALFFPYIDHVIIFLFFIKVASEMIFQHIFSTSGMCVQCVDKSWPIVLESHHQKKERKEDCGEPYGVWLYLLIIKVMEFVWLQQPTWMWTMSWISTWFSWKMRRRTSVTNKYIQQNCRVQFIQETILL